MTPDPSVNIDRLSPVLVRNMPVGLVIFDAKARIHSHNPLFAVMFGNMMDTGDHTIGELIEPGALGSFLEEFSALVKGRQDSLEMTCRYRAADGSHEKWMHIHVVPLPSASMPGPTEDLFYAIIDDVTNNIDENQRLLREKELAIQATRSKSSFLATMSHEIRTPIHTITGMTGLLADTVLDDEQQEYTTQIRFSAEILLGLINDILDISKIEAGRLSLEIIEFDLIKAIEESVDMQSLAAFTKGLELHLLCDDEVPRLVRGDPARLRQILTNLLSNAIKFTKHGEVGVRIKASGSDRQHRRVRFEVRDSGIGIAAEKRELLFQAFSQLDSSMTRRFGGTGLGLSICKSLVSLMSGDIGVDSREGRGSVFWFDIPFELVPSAPPPPPVLAEAWAELKILVVDDSAGNRQVIRTLLEDHCRQIFEAENADMALGMLRAAAGQRQPFQLVLVDLEMSGIDGWQFASQVNADRSINDTRLFLMVPPGKMGGEAKMKLLNWFDDYVAKPIKRQDLLDVLNRKLETTLDLSTTDEEPEGTGVTLSPPAIPAPAAAAPDRDTPSPVNGLRILVAEDHPVNQKLFETILNRLGHTIILASDGREALEKSLRGDPALVFMDVQMPEMNGFEATQALRQAGFKSPIIAVTANALKGDQDKCLQSGMNDYLSKPFQKSDVEGMIAKWLSATGARLPARPGPSPAAAPSAETGPVPEAPQAAKDEAADETAVFDHAKALAVFMDDRETLVAVLRDYIKRTDMQIQAIASSLDGGDARTAGLHSHTIKGASWNLGITRLGNAAHNIEQACKAPDLETARQGIPELRRAWQDFLLVSRRFLGG